MDSLKNYAHEVQGQDLNTLTPGAGIGVTNGAGSITIANTGVLSFSGGSTGLTPATATTGAVTLAGILDVDNGGTGQTTYTNGQLLIGNTTGNTLTKATLTAGTGITISNGAGSITINGTGGTVTSVSVVSANGFAGTVATSTTTPAITLTTTVTGILKGNGTAISAAVSGTDYAPATSGTSILYGNGAGGFSNVTVGTGLTFATGTLSTSGTVTTNAPVTKTADFSVASTDTWLINNKTGSTCTVTLPSPSANTGRVLYFINYQNQLLVSASSNVVSRAGGAAGTAILDNVAGNWATIVSDGTNWITTQAASNNNLLLE
jgi:hypothetical protein